MAYQLGWRRPAIISLICHMFFFVGAGYLSAHMASLPLPEEKYVELELMNEAQAPSPRDTSLPNEEPSTPNSAPLTKMPQVSSPSNETPITETQAVVTTEGLTVASVSPPETSSSPAESSSTNTSTAANTSSTSGGGSKAGSSGIIAPSILDKVDPVYPPSVRQAGIEGTVVLKIQILDNGHSGSISIARSSGNEQLDASAIRAVGQWRFIPAKDRASGQALSCYTTIPIAFHLR